MCYAAVCEFYVLSLQTIIMYYTTIANFSMKYLMVCMVYTDGSGIKQLCYVCPSVREIVHSLKLVDYLHVQAVNQWYNYYLIGQGARRMSIGHIACKSVLIY